MTEGDMPPQNEWKVAVTSGEILGVRYRYFYTAKNNGNKKTLADIIKFISVLENCNPGLFSIILKLVLQGRRWYQNQLYGEMLLSTHFLVPGHK